MKVLQLIWTDASWHPVVAFTAQLFSERGDRVRILYRNPDAKFALPGRIDFGKNSSLHPTGRGRSGLGNQLDYLKFLLKAFVMARRIKPDVIIGYDMHGVVAAYFAKLARRDAALVYHNLDLSEGASLRIYGRVLQLIEEKGVRWADCVLFSSAGRARFFKNKTSLPLEPIVVKNCQRIGATEARTGELHKILADRGLHFDRLVVRLGSLGPNHGIEATIRSILEWKGNWGLILAGVPYGSYLEEMQRLIASTELQDKVLLLSGVSHSLWYDCLYSADIGIALYEEGNINHASMAGAGNKLNLYLKAGIPSILPTISDFGKLVEKYKVGVVANPTDPTSIANAINSVLCDAEAYEFLAHNARLAFEAEFNFEKQFEPVIEFLTTKIEQRKTGNSS